MYHWKINKLATDIIYVCVLLFMMTGVACSYETLTITGKVVDESGNSLNDVSVWACYSGWGWGEEGYLVWDKNYCSETIQTNHEGWYVITFKGPVSSRLKARKKGWVQARDFNTTHSRIVLTRSEDHSSRLRAEAKQRDLEHRRRRAEESETDYYCRVILPENQPVNLNYQDEILAVTPTLLEISAQNDALFSVRGSFTGVNSFSDELVIKINGEMTESNLLLKQVESICSLDVHFIRVNIPSLNTRPDAAGEVFVPSINAMFDVKIYAYSVQQ